MTDEEFAIEYVLRIRRPASTKTQLELIKIVLNGEPIDPDSMFSDIQIERLHSNNNVYQDVYKFVRDNQHLFIKE